MTERPYVHIRPARVGYVLTMGQDGPIPIKIGDSSWRPTRRMAENRARRWLRRVAAANAREEAAWSLEPDDA